MQEFSNYNLDDIITPIRVDVLEQLLTEANYDNNETKFIVDGFRNGFPIGYMGVKSRRTTAHNLKLRCGTKADLWNKVMKEVKLGRYAGPFETIPYQNYIQSPIGLIPKHEPGETWLIFHLSHPRGDSVNSNMPKKMTSVKYKDLDNAIRLCREVGIGCYIAKTDFKSALRVLPIKPEDRCWLVMKAQHPISKRFFYFVDKCLPFGASISCSHFQ